MTAVIRMLQQFNPQTEAADFYRIRIDIHPEQAVFDNGLIFSIMV